MSHLIVLSGYSGSGKSTLVKQLQQGNCYAVIRSDDYHHCWEPGMDVTGVLLSLAIAFGRNGISVIVDAVNKHPDDYRRWLEARIIFSSFEWMDLNVPIEECIRRDALRPKPVGSEAIRSQQCQGM